MMNKLVFVTGGGRGIGKGIVKEMLENNYYVAIGYKNSQKTALEFQERNNNAFAVLLDITSRDSINKAIKSCERHFNKPISILINNAAIAQEKAFDTITDIDWDKMLAANLRGPFACCQEVLPDMLNIGWGRIINITSIGGQWGGINQVHYAASKAALINLTQSIAKIYSKHGITCNAVAIGLAQTDMSSRELNSIEGKIKVSAIPIGRIATIEEIAHTVKFLCSEDASYITGQTINLNGGMYFG